MGMGMGMAELVEWAVGAISHAKVKHSGAWAPTLREPQLSVTRVGLCER